jgi:hypothetical protein
MRVAVHEYAKGGHTAYETSDDGGVFIKEWAGPQKVGERLCAFIEVGCDNNEQGLDRLLEAMAWLAEEIKKRKTSPVGVNADHR